MNSIKKTEDLNNQEDDNINYNDLDDQEFKKKMNNNNFDEI